MTAVPQEIRHINPSFDYSDVWDVLETPQAPKALIQKKALYNHENDTDDVMPEYSDGMNDLVQKISVRKGFDNSRPNPDA